MGQRLSCLQSHVVEEASQESITVGPPHLDLSALANARVGDSSYIMHGPFAFPPHKRQGGLKRPILHSDF